MGRKRGAASKVKKKKCNVPFSGKKAMLSMKKVNHESFNSVYESFCTIMHQKLQWGSIQVVDQTDPRLEALKDMVNNKVSPSRLPAEPLILFKHQCCWCIIIFPSVYDFLCHDAFRRRHKNLTCMSRYHQLIIT